LATSRVGQARLDLRGMAAREFGMGNPPSVTAALRQERPE
jgi:hypothetical protein